MSHRDAVESEFSRQARAFAAAPVLAAADVTEPITRALDAIGARRVVDLACGPGVVTQRLVRSGRDVIGVDLTPAVLLHARERLAQLQPAPGWVRAAAERTPFADACADGVVLRLALHHMETPVAALREARRLLRPGGRVVVLDVVNSEDPATARLRDAIEILRDPSHCALLSPPELREAVRDAGLTVCEERSWERERRYDEWAAIIADPPRMRALERTLGALLDAGQRCGMNLHRLPDGGLAFDYRFALVVAEPA